MNAKQAETKPTCLSLKQTDSKICQTRFFSASTIEKGQKDAKL